MTRKSKALEHATQGDETAKDAPEMHPMLQETVRLAKELGNMGIPWSWGVVRPGEMQPFAMVVALANLLVAKGVCTQDELDTEVYSVLHGMTARLLEAAKKARGAPQLYVPDGAQVPPELMKNGRNVD